MADMTDEELEKRVAAVKGRTGIAGKIADFADPGTRKSADAAAQELERRRKAKEAADKAAPAVPAKEFVFKKGGAVRGDGVAQRGKTRGRMV